MVDGSKSSQDPAQQSEPAEIQDASLDDTVGGAARFQTVKPTKKGGSVYADPEEGGE